MPTRLPLLFRPPAHTHAWPAGTRVDDRHRACLQPGVHQRSVAMDVTTTLFVSRPRFHRCSHPQACKLGPWSSARQLVEAREAAADARKERLATAGATVDGVLCHMLPLQQLARAAPAPPLHPPLAGVQVSVPFCACRPRDRLEAQPAGLAKRRASARPRRRAGSVRTLLRRRC